MNYQALKMYYLTGTGNSFRVASWMVEVADRKGVVSECIQACRNVKPHPAGPATTLVGMVAPTHAFTAPWSAIRFVLGLPRGHGQHCFAVTTRAGTKFGPVFLPGLEGTAAYLLGLLFLLKGYRLRGVRGIDMPSNWLALHPGYGERNARAITQRNHPLATGFIERILDGKTCFRGFLPLALGLALTPVSLGYLLIGRFYLGKLFFASHCCTGCGLCAEICPNQALRMAGKKRPLPYWTFHCESCMRCMAFCPEKAIEASHPFAVFLVFVAVAAVPGLLLSWIGQWVSNTSLTGGFLEQLVGYGYTLLAIFFIYPIFYLATRFRFLARLFAYSTPTVFYHRYQEPDTKLSEIKPKDNTRDPR